MNIMNVSSMPVGGDENVCAQAVWHMLQDASTLAGRLLDCTAKHTAVDCVHGLIDLRSASACDTGRTQYALALCTWYRRLAAMDVAHGRRLGAPAAHIVAFGEYACLR